MSTSKKITNYILFIVFILFAFVQLNDPDPLVWFTIYALAACICLYSNFKIIPKGFLTAIIVLLLIYAMYHFSLFITYLKTDNKNEIFGKMVYKKPYLEGSREFLGLIIAALAVFYQKQKNRKISQ